MPAKPLAISVRICSAVSSSSTGAPGMAISTTAKSGWLAGPTVSQRKFPSSGTVASTRTSQPSFSRVERERLVLVVHPELGVGDLDHQGSSWSNSGSTAKLARGGPAVFSKRAVLRTAVDARDAARDHGVRGGRRIGRAVGGRRHPEHPPEARRERADALQPDREADVGDRAVGRPQQRGRALEPARQQVLVRRLTERAPELTAEVRRRQAGRAREVVDRRAARRSGRRRGPWRAGDGGRVGRTPPGQYRRSSPPPCLPAQ